MTVSDMDRSVDFFTNVLTFEKVSDVEVAGSEYERLQACSACACESCACGSATSRSSSPSTSRRAGGRSRSTHAATIAGFSTSRSSCRDMDAAYARLRQHEVEHASPDRSGCRTGTRTRAASRRSTSRTPTAIRSRSCSSRRQGRSEVARARTGLFLGIDHTAIVVADTEASLRFYRDLLGLRVAGESENYGPEQEHLNNVFGARLRITGLRAADGPGHRVARVSRPA